MNHDLSQAPSYSEYDAARTALTAAQSDSGVDSEEAKAATATMMEKLTKCLGELGLGM